MSGMSIPGWVVAAHIQRVTADVARRRKPRYGFGLVAVLALLFISLAVFGRGIA